MKLDTAPNISSPLPAGRRLRLISWMGVPDERRAYRFPFQTQSCASVSSTGLHDTEHPREIDIRKQWPGDAADESPIAPYEAERWEVFDSWSAGAIAFYKACYSADFDPSPSL